MSEPSQEARGVRARVSRWRATRRGTKTLKAAYAQAARDVKRMDPAVREQIGRANMTRADLQMLAGAHVDAQFRPDRYGRVSQQLGSELSARAQARPAPGPTRNPLRQVANRYSRWRNTRQGTKALKAAFTQAARDVKRTDPAVRLAIGRSTINRSDLAALASSRMDQVFRPEGRFQNAPGQQQGQQRGQQQLGAGGAGSSQMIQSRDAVRQEPQSEQMSQRIVALQQAIIENQARTMALMEENNRLQAQMRDLLQARAGEVQQQGGQNQVTPELDQTGQQQDNPNQQPQAQQPEAQQPQQPEAQQPEAQQPQTQQPESQQPQQPEAQQPEAQQPGAQQPQTQQPEVQQPQAPQAQQPGGQQPQAQQPEAQQPQQPEGQQPEAQQPQAQQPEAQQPQTQQPGAQEPRAQQPEAQQPQQPQPQAQQPGGQRPGGQRPGGQQPQAQQPEAQQPQRAEGQQGGVNSRDVKVGGPDAAGKSAKELDTKFARDIAMGGQTPLNKVSVQRSEGATKAGGDDPNRRQQRGNQTPARNNPSGKDGR
jgi:hypothetical protein